MFGSFGDSGVYSQGWTGTPAVLTTASGTQAANASSGLGVANTTAGVSSPTCTLCKKPAFVEGAFFVGVVLLALGWHFHVFSMIES